MNFNEWKEKYHDDIWQSYLKSDTRLMFSAYRLKLWESRFDND